MRPPPFFLLILLPVVSGWVGYSLGAMREVSVMQMPRGTTVALDQLVSPESFSEVEQARAVLDALAARYVENAQVLIVQEILSRNARPEGRPPRANRPVLDAIQRLDEVIPEFRGTGVELQLLPTLLAALKHERLHDRWLEVYLDLLYRHPTHTLVGVLAEQAAAISHLVGREADLRAGFRYVSRIPLDSPAKAAIERALLRHCVDSSTLGDPCEQAS